MRAVILALVLFPGSALADQPDPQAGAETFRAYCAACHGAEAKGDGPMGEILIISPPDLTSLSATNGGVFPVTRVVRRIDGRDPMLSHGGDMPLFGQIFDFPDTAIAAETGQPILTAQPIADIMAWLERIQR